MQGAKAGRWLWWGDATTLATARFPELVQPSLGCGFPGGGADTDSQAWREDVCLYWVVPVPNREGSLSAGCLSWPQVLVGGHTRPSDTVCREPAVPKAREELCDPAGCPGLSHRSFSRLTWLSCCHFWQAGPRDAEQAVSLSICAFLAGQDPAVRGSVSSPLSWGPQKGC